MASGDLNGPAPDRLYVLKNDYEIRYFTTPETVSQAIVSGYNGEVVVYRKAEVPPKVQIDKIMDKNPGPPLPSIMKNGWPTGALIGFRQPSPALQVAIAAHEKAQKLWRKKVKVLLVALLERY